MILCSCTSCIINAAVVDKMLQCTEKPFHFHVVSGTAAQHWGTFLKNYHHSPELSVSLQ